MPDAPAIPPRTLNLLVGLLRSYMHLQADQAVVYNQKWRIPADSRLYISVGFLAVKHYGTTQDYETAVQSGVAVLKEVTGVSSQETVTVNTYSRGPEAIDRKDEVVLAFNSTQCAQLCDANAMKVGRVPASMTDVSAVEGTSRLNRFALTLNLLCARRQERVVEYFDKFQDTALIINP